MTDNLQQAIDAVQAGDKKRGQGLLSSIIQSNPRSELAWYWMVKAVDDLERKKECLGRVLTINPDNQQAARELLQLQQPAPTKKTGPRVERPAKMPAKKGSVGKMLLVVVLGIILGCAGLYGFVIILTSNHEASPQYEAPLAPTSTRPLAAASTPTHTARPATSISPTNTRSSGPSGPSQTPVVHVVQPGDTLGAIAQQYRISLDDILTANSIEDPSRIAVSQEIVIPPSSDSSHADPNQATPEPTNTPMPQVPTSPTLTSVPSSTNTPLPTHTPRPRPTEAPRRLDPKLLALTASDIAPLSETPSLWKPQRTPLPQR